MIRKIIIYFLILTINLSSLNLSFAQQKQEGIKSLCIFLRNLKIGSKGEDVKCLQKYLKELNLFKHNPTGYYGFLTRNAVLKWQKINGLKQTGIFDLNSIMKYYSLNYYLVSRSEKQNKNSKSNQISQNLFLSSIEDKDISISDKGILNIEEYLKEFNLRMSNSEKYGEIAIKMFPTSSVNTTSLFSYTEPLSPDLFVENNLKFNLESKELLRKKALLLREFINIQIEELKKISVHPDLKEFHKSIILTDYLSVELLSKFLDYLDGKISEGKMMLLIEEYRNIIEKIKANLHEIYFKLQNKISFFDNLYKFLSYLFFLPQKALALIYFAFPPFGGKILNPPIPCFDAPLVLTGFLIYIGPPIPTILYVPIWFLSSPLLFMFRNILTPQVWVFGLRTQIPHVCLHWIWVPGGIFGGGHWVPVPVGTGFIIFEAGTGLIPSPL